MLAREELGLNPDVLGSPWQAAALSFVSSRSAPPCRSFRCWPAPPATMPSSPRPHWRSSALRGVGMALSLFTGRGAWRGALRMVLIGGGAGPREFLVGRRWVSRSAEQ